MVEKIRPVNPMKLKKQVKRPVFLSILCLFSFVYFTVTGIIFLLSTIFSDRIAEVVNTYVPEDAFTPAQVLLLFSAGFLLNALAFTGVLIIWKLHRSGYFILTAACLMLAVFQLLQPRAAINTTAVYIAMIILFGLFYHKLTAGKNARSANQVDDVVAD